MRFITLSLVSIFAVGNPVFSMDNEESTSNLSSSRGELKLKNLIYSTPENSQELMLLKQSTGFDSPNLSGEGTPYTSWNLLEDGKINGKNTVTFQTSDYNGQVNKKSSENIKALWLHVDSLLKDDVKPEEVSIIIDIDGTLTHEPDPSKVRFPENPLKPSPKNSKNYTMKYMVTDLIEKGVNVVFSSAWNNLEDTCARLNYLGFGKYLDGEKKEGEIHLDDNVYGTFIQKGRAISVKKNPWDTFYKEKFFSAGIYLGEKAQDVKYLYFTDDSREHMKNFKKAVNEHNIYPHIKTVSLFPILIPKITDKKVNTHAVSAITLDKKSSDNNQKKLGHRRSQEILYTPSDKIFLNKNPVHPTHVEKTHKTLHTFLNDEQHIPLHQSQILDVSNNDREIN